MNILRVIIPFLLGITCLSGCATLVTGSRDYVSINSSPSGAKVTINGKSKGVTPLYIKLKKKHNQHITFEAEGYSSQTYLLKREPRLGYMLLDIAGGFVLAGVTGGFIPLIPAGITIDAFTGAMYTFATDSVYVKLYRPEDTLIVLKERPAITDSLKAARKAKYQEKLQRKHQQYDSLIALKPLWNIVSVHATQAFVREWQFSYEKFIHPKWSIETSAGIRIPKKSDTPEIIESGYMLSRNDFIFPFTQSYYSSLSFRKYQLQAARPYNLFYWSGTIFYRYSYYENEIYGYSSPNYSSTYVAWESKYQHIPGVKFTLGWRVFILPYTSNQNLTFDLFGGAGLRIIYNHEIQYGGFGGSHNVEYDVNRITPYSQPFISKNRSILPSIQVGLKLGFAWRK